MRQYKLQLIALLIQISGITLICSTKTIAQLPYIEFEGSINIGNNTSSNPTNGTMRWTGDDLQIRKDSFWISLLTNQVIGNVVMDIDGNVYPTVQIGNQQWMAENLKTSRFKDGSPIPLVENLSDWNSLSTAAYDWYDSDNSLDQIYGKLYNWYAVDDSRGLCPEGWHIPSTAEVVEMSTFLGGDIVSGGKLKEVGTEYWNFPNTGATNDFGFSARPGGLKSTAFVARSLGAYFFTSDTQASSADFFILRYTNDNMVRNTSSKKTGCSIRCIKN